MKKILLVAALCLPLAAPLAMAEDAPGAADARAITVAYDDLDLSASDDAAQMLARLRRAAFRACSSPEIDTPTPEARRQSQACRADAVESAVAQLDAPELTRLHRIRDER